MDCPVKLCKAAKSSAVTFGLVMRKMCFLMLLAANLGLAGKAHAQMVRIRIQEAETFTAVTYQALGDEAVITTADSFPVEIMRLKTLERLEVENNAGKIQITHDGKIIGRYPGIYIWCNDESPKFSLILPRKKPQVVTYPDHLLVKPLGSGLQLVNQAHLEHYIAGVVQAEAGGHKSLEFFKVQAVSARTYALMHLGRHEGEGFDLCDKTHCQAYAGVPGNNPLLIEAVKKTKNEVIVFGDTALVEAVFSANCGGHTANSEDVWVKKIDYLRAVPDMNYCEGFQNHSWHLTLSQAEFFSRLGKYHNTDVTSFEIIPDVSGRVKRMELNDDPRYTISGEELRKILGVKSSRFHIAQSSGMVFIEGEGFGHGVGMCQDGAYHLSEMGLDYLKIIRHYYQEVGIKDLREVKIAW